VVYISLSAKAWRRESTRGTFWFARPQDLQMCVHELRLTVEDELFVATLVRRRELRLLDLTEILEEGVTEFESLQGRGSLKANRWDGQSAGKPSIKLRTVSSGACRPSRIISVMSGARKALRSVRLT
jgi:hypothetical protein